MLSSTCLACIAIHKDMAVVIFYYNIDSTENSLKHSAAECEAAGMKIRYMVLKQVLKLSLHIKLSLYWSVSIPLTTYGHELRVVTERIRS